MVPDRDLPRWISFPGLDETFALQDYDWNARRSKAAIKKLTETKNQNIYQTDRISDYGQVHCHYHLGFY